MQAIHDQQSQTTANDWHAFARAVEQESRPGHADEIVRVKHIYPRMFYAQREEI
jgi:hypothetical protein